MGVLLPELDGAIGKSVAQGYNKWVCLGIGGRKISIFLFEFNSFPALKKVLQNVGILISFAVLFPVAYYGPCWLRE